MTIGTSSTTSERGGKCDGDGAVMVAGAAPASHVRFTPLFLIACVCAGSLWLASVVARSGTRGDGGYSGLSLRCDPGGDGGCQRMPASDAVTRDDGGRPSPAPGNPSSLPGVAAADGSRRVVTVPDTLPSQCAFTYRFWFEDIAYNLRYWPTGTITGSMMEEETPPIVIRMQLIDGALYYRTYVSGYDYPDRPQAMMEQVRSAVAAYYPHLINASAGAKPPDVDFRFHISDVPGFEKHGMEEFYRTMRGPLLGMCTIDTSITTAVPDYSYAFWRETGMGEERQMTYADLMPYLLHASLARPYHTRIKKATFRGDLRNVDRADSKPVFLGNEDIFDLGWEPTDEGRHQAPVTAPLPMRHFCNYSVQIYVAGNGYSARLKYLLMTGSPVVYYDASWRGRMREWFYPGLIPGVHVLVVYHPQLLADTVRWLLAHPDEAQRIGQAGQQFALDHLMPEKVQCWWHSFFHVLSSKMEHPIARMNRSSHLPLGSSLDQVYQSYQRNIGAQHRIRDKKSRREVVGSMPPEDDFYWVA